MNFQKSLGAPTRARLSFRNARVLALSFGLSAGALFHSANAATQVYDDAGASNVWDLSTPNWDAGVVWTNGNNAVFGGTGEIVEVDGAISANGTASALSGLRFTAAAGGYDITDTNNNGSLTLTGSDIISTTNSTAGTSNTVSVNLTLGGGGVKTITLSGPASGSAGIILSGNIGESTPGTSLKVVRAGGSMNTYLTLSGNNTFTGGVELLAASGRLNINSATALGTGNLSITTGSGTIDNTSGSAITLANNNNINVTTAGFTFSGANDLSFGSGVLNLAAGAQGRTFTANAGVFTVGGITEAAVGNSLTKAGSGTMAITGASSFSGSMTLSAGGVILGNKASLGTGQVGINSIAVSASSNLSGVNAITNNYTLGGSSTVFQGSNSIEWAGSGTATGSRTLTNSITGGTLTFSNALALSSNGNNNTLTITGNGSTLISGAISNGTAGSTSSGLTKAGSGTLALTSANTYGGATTLSAGTLVIGNGTTGSIGGGAVSVAAGTLTGNLASGFNIGTSGTPLTTIGNSSGSGDAIITGGNGTAGSIGRLATAGALTLASDSSFVFDLNSTSGVADQVLADGTTTIAAGAQFTFNYTGNGAGLFLGQTFTALGGAGAINGVAFTGLAEGQVFNVGAYQFTANNYLAADELTFTVTAVPEPSTLVMLLGGFGVAFGLRRTRRRSA